MSHQSIVPTPMVASPTAPSVGPLSFPYPTFASARRLVDTHSSEGCFFTLVSQATGRSWRAISFLRECQFGEVVHAVELMKTGVPMYFAIKDLSVDKIRNNQGQTQEDPLREVSVLQYLSREEHPNVLQCTEVLTDDESIYIVMPFCSGGEMFDIVSRKGSFAEHEARPLFRQVLSGLQHLKNHGFCHRDVSLENLLVDGGNHVKLIDFGLALRIPQDADGRATALPPQGRCGKQFYMSPEVSTNVGDFDGFAVDVWACGVMLFIMLTGIPPFQSASASLDKRCRIVAVEGRLANLLSMWKISLSPEVIDLMQSCLLYAPERRSTLEVLRNHPWINA